MSEQKEFVYERVKIAKKFAEKYIRPYRGCPRGPQGNYGFADSMPLAERAMRYLSESEENVLVGADENYICIPEEHVRSCIEMLDQLLKEAEK